MASRPDVSRMSVDGIFEHLAQTLYKTLLQENRSEPSERAESTDESFLELTDGDLRELLPKLGERKAVQRLIKSFLPQ